MSGLSTSPGIPQHQQQAAFTPDWQLQSNLLDATAPFLLDSPGEDTKSSRRRSKHRHKKRRKQRLGAYILQIIGLICLVLAAVKAFEPLTGVGFTLVMVGYKGGFGGGDAGGECRGIRCAERSSLITYPEGLKAERKERERSKKRRRDREAKQKELMKVEVGDDD